jgi:hypothetical protein
MVSAKAGHDLAVVDRFDRSGFESGTGNLPA